MKHIICFSGVSGSGKTTLIEKISKQLKKDNAKVSIIKNDPKNKAVFDVDGKDSDRFFKTKADVVVTSPKKTTFFINKSLSIQEIINKLDFEYLLIEGHKELPYPRISVFRDEVHSDYVDISHSFACKNIKDFSMIEDKNIFELDDIKSIILWIKEQNNG